MIGTGSGISKTLGVVLPRYFCLLLVNTRVFLNSFLGLRLRLVVLAIFYSSEWRIRRLRTWFLLWVDQSEGLFMKLFLVVYRPVLRTEEFLDWIWLLPRNELSFLLGSKGLCFPISFWFEMRLKVYFSFSSSLKLISTDLLAERVVFWGPTAKAFCWAKIWGICLNIGLI